MAISRSDMERQLRKDGGILNKPQWLQCPLGYQEISARHRDSSDRNFRPSGTAGPVSDQQ